MHVPEVRDERILVVDDEPEIVTLVEWHLVNAGYHVVSAGTGAEAFGSINREPPALLILDVMLPDISGIDLLTMLRSAPATANVPVLMLTALREDMDRIRGLSLGADDYLTKPFNPEELVLRVGAILRRAKPGEQPDLVTTVGPISINRLTHRATTRGAVLDLTATEYRLLVTLVEGQGGILGRAKLLAAVWGASPDIHTRTVDVHVQRLREKLGDAAAMIETIRGLGYRLNAGRASDA